MRTQLETERLVLRLRRQEDAYAWSAATDDAEVMRYIGGSDGAASQSIDRAAVRNATWTDLDPPRLVSLIRPDNARSIRVAERLGARFERDVESVDVGPLQVWVYER
jgi:RimJ/RimL family protein N-acetyltransferase